jgi:vacuolar-type H+-ATPase subunit F/Vma7
MGRIAAIGESVRVEGLGLAGVLVLPGDDPDEVRNSWATLPTDVAVVVLTQSAAALLDDERRDRLTVVMPP